MKICYITSILEFLHRKKNIVLKNPKKVIFEKPKVIENALDTGHIHCHTPTDISLHYDIQQCNKCLNK
jgi:hypothetical protein